MAFTYGADPANDDRDVVRLLVADTDSNNPLLEDAEIDYWISQEPSLIDAAVRAAENIAAQFARKADDVSAGDVRVRLQNRAERYWNLAGKLETRKTKGDVGKLANEVTGQDDETEFSLEQFDNEELF